LGFNSTISHAIIFLDFGRCSIILIAKYGVHPSGDGALTPGAQIEEIPSKSIEKNIESITEINLSSFFLTEDNYSIQMKI
jgi:hypothetical protein